MHVLRWLRWLCVFVGAWLCAGWAHPAEARPIPPPSDAQIQQAVEQAIEIDAPGGSGEPVKLRRRDDLREDFSEIDRKSGGNVAFYDLESPAAAAARDDSMWAVVWGDPAQQAYRLYRFDSSQDFQQSSQEFDRLASELAVSIPVSKAADLARFFLKCCVRDAPGQVVDNDDALHHAVERYYLEAFGDVWRALEESMYWWQGYEKEAGPAVPGWMAAGGTWNIALRRVFLGFGMHPQMQQWQIQVGRDGRLRVASVEPIFPKQGLWLSYDFRSTIKPIEP